MISFINFILSLLRAYNRRNWYDNKVSPATRDAVFRAYGEQCLRCGSTTNVQIDHVIPKSWGGSHDFSNLQPLCGSCNRSKSNRNAADYR